MHYSRVKRHGDPQVVLKSGPKNVSSKEELRQRARDRFNARYHRNRREALDLLGGRCNECGSAENLHFDHIDPDLKEYEMHRVFVMNAEVREAELAKCQLLCHSCHMRKSRQDEIRRLGNVARWAS